MPPPLSWKPCGRSGPFFHSIDKIGFSEDCACGAYGLSVPAASPGVTRLAATASPIVEKRYFAIMFTL